MRQHGTISSADVAVLAMRDKGLDPDTDPVTRVPTSCAALVYSSMPYSGTGKSSGLAREARCGGGFSLLLNICETLLYYGGCILACERAKAIMLDRHHE